VSLLIAIVLGVLGMVALTVLSSSSATIREIIAGICAQVITAGRVSRSAQSAVDQ
jgi:Tfp pilus assembly protein PilV